MTSNKRWHNFLSFVNLKQDPCLLHSLLIKQSASEWVSSRLPTDWAAWGETQNQGVGPHRMAARVPGTGSLNLLHGTLVDFSKSCTFCTFTVRGFIYQIYAEKPSWLKWERGAPGAVGNPEQEGGASQDVECFWIFHTQVYQRLNLINYSLQTAKSTTWAYNVLMYLVGWKLLCIRFFSVKKKLCQIANWKRRRLCHSPVAVAALLSVPYSWEL